MSKSKGTIGCISGGVQSDTTSKLLTSPYFHTKEKWIVKAHRVKANIQFEQHCVCYILCLFNFNFCAVFW